MPLETPIYPGIDLNDNYGPQLVSVGTACVCLSAGAVILRATARWCSDVKFGRDDWLLFAAAFFCWIYIAMTIVLAERNHLGQHIGTSSPTQLQSFREGLYVLAIIYPIALTMSKLSLLSLYWRIFHVPHAKLPIYVAAGLNLGWMTSAVLVGILSCNPVRGFWDSTIRSQCVQEYDFFLSNECFTLALDLIVLLIPIWFIAQIRRSISQRISISFTFALGLLTTIISAIRLWQLVEAQRRPGEDPTFNQTGAALWAMVEISGWIVIATIPSLRLLMTRAILKWRELQGSRKVPAEKMRTTSQSPGTLLRPERTHRTSNEPCRRDGHRDMTDFGIAPVSITAGPLSEAVMVLPDEDYPNGIRVTHCVRIDIE